MNKKTIGSSGTNKGKQSVIEESMIQIDLTRKCHVIDVLPIGAVRMTRADRWRKRPAVLRYFEFKDSVIKECNKVGFELKNNLDVVFFLPMPESWSLKKKEKMNGMPHKSRPDIDNIVKGFMDALKDQDGDIWFIKAEKRYAHKGSILIYE
jgi:Holliday junction resolvase RusA-like endonuclease